MYNTLQQEFERCGVTLEEAAEAIDRKPATLQSRIDGKTAFQLGEAGNLAKYLQSKGSALDMKKLYREGLQSEY